MSGTASVKSRASGGQSQQQLPQDPLQSPPATSRAERSPAGDTAADNFFFSLKWNEFDKQLSSGFSSLFHTQDFADVTLCCEGTQARAHKIVLAMCSPYFRSIFKENPCKHPVVIIKGIKFRDLQHVLKFIYFGQVSVVKNEIQDFIDAAELLKLDGISSDSSDQRVQPETGRVTGTGGRAPTTATPASTPGSSSTKDTCPRVMVKQEFSPTQSTSKYSADDLESRPAAGPTPPSISGTVSRSYESISPAPGRPYSASDRDAAQLYASGGAGVSRKHVFSTMSPGSESALQHHHASVINHGRKKSYSVPWTSPTAASTVPLHVSIPGAASVGKVTETEENSNESGSHDLSPGASVRSKNSPADPLGVFPGAAAPIPLSVVAVSRSSSCDTTSDPLALDHHQLQPHLPVLINLEESAEESQDSMVTESNAGEYELSIQTVESPYGHLKSFTTPSGMVVSTLHGHSLHHPSTSGHSSTGPSGWVVGMGQLLKPSTVTSATHGVAGSKSGSSSAGPYRSSAGSSPLLYFPNGPLIPKVSSGAMGAAEASSSSHVQGASVPAVPAKKRFSHLGHRFQLYSDLGYATEKSALDRHRHLAKLSGAAHTMTEASGASSAGPLALMMTGSSGTSTTQRDSSIGLGAPRFKNQRHSQVPQSARYTTAEVDAMVDSVTNHSGPFVPCKICDKLVKRERLRAHIHECHLVHGEKIICPHCGVGLKSKGSYRVHVWRHRRGVLAKGLKAKRVLGQRPRDPGPGAP